MNTQSIAKISRVEACIFDLDGTLIDSVGDIANAINHALNKLELATVSRDQVREWVGAGLPVLCQRAAAYAHINDRWHDIERWARPYYQKHCAETTVAYEGIEALLAGLQQYGLPMAVLSNKPHDMVVEVLRALGLEQYFLVARGYVDEATKKPAPHVAEEICRALNHAPEHVAMVGDSVIDIETARNAGMVSIAVTWGFEPPVALATAGPDMMVDSTAELRVCLVKQM